MLTVKKDGFNTRLLDGGNTLFTSSLYVFVILILWGIILKVGISKISEQRRTLASIKSRIAALSEKENELSKAQGDLVAIFYGPVSNALPKEDPVLVSFSEIKSLLGLYLLPIDEYSVSIGGDSQDLTKINDSRLRITVLGDMGRVTSFLEEVENLAPLALVDRVAFSGEGGGLIAEVSIRSFWSPFIFKAQSLEETSFQKINDVERNTLVNLSGLKQPVVLDMTPNGPFSREDLF